VARQWPQCRQGRGGAGHAAHDCSTALARGRSVRRATLDQAGRGASRQRGKLEAEIRRLRAENTNSQTQTSAKCVKKISGILSEVPAQRYARIAQMSADQYKVAWLCEALLVSRERLLPLGGAAPDPARGNSKTSIYASAFAR